MTTATETIDWTFETSRIRGRLVAEGDAGLYRDLYTDASVMRHVGETMTVEQASEAFSRALRHNANPAARARYWHIFDRVGGRSMGLASLVRDAARPQAAEIGLMLLVPFQRTGVGQQALAAIIDGALTARKWPLALEDVTVRHVVDNIAVTSLVESLGFMPERIAESGFLAWHVTADSWVADAARRSSRMQRLS